MKPLLSSLTLCRYADRNRATAINMRKAPKATCKPLIQATARTSPLEGVTPPPICMSTPMGLLVTNQ